MLGVGAPPALQLKVSSRPSRTVRFSGGDSITGAEANLDDDKQSKQKRNRERDAKLQLWLGSLPLTFQLLLKGRRKLC